jgi:hypothetical protein
MSAKKVDPSAKAKSGPGTAKGKSDTGKGAGRNLAGSSENPSRLPSSERGDDAEGTDPFKDNSPEGRTEKGSLPGADADAVRQKNAAAAATALLGGQQPGGAKPIGRLSGVVDWGPTAESGVGKKQNASTWVESTAFGSAGEAAAAFTEQDAIQDRVPSTTPADAGALRFSYNALKRNHGFCQWFHDRTRDMVSYNQFLRETGQNSTAYPKGVTHMCSMGKTQMQDVMGNVDIRFSTARFKDANLSQDETRNGYYLMSGFGECTWMSDDDKFICTEKASQYAKEDVKRSGIIPPAPWPLDTADFKRFFTAREITDIKFWHMGPDPALGLAANEVLLCHPRPPNDDWSLALKLVLDRPAARMRSDTVLTNPTTVSLATIASKDGSYNFNVYEEMAGQHPIEPRFMALKPTIKSTEPGQVVPESLRHRDKNDPDKVALKEHAKRQKTIDKAEEAKKRRVSRGRGGGEGNRASAPGHLPNTGSGTAGTGTATGIGTGASSSSSVHP